MKNSKPNSTVKHWETFACKPHFFLGPHTQNNGEKLIRVYSPNTRSVELTKAKIAMRRDGETDYFVWHGSSADIEQHYTINVTYNSNETHSFIDP